MQATKTREIDLEVVIKDLLRKDLLALHKHYDNKQTTGAHHGILHPQTNLTLTYDANTSNLFFPKNYFSTLQLTATNNGHKIYEITRKHLLTTKKQTLQTKLKEEKLSEDHFISHLLYLEKEQEIKYKDLQQASKYINQLLKN